MASTEVAFRKIEQAKALIEEAQSLVEEKSNAEKQVQELKRILKEKEEQLLQKDKEIQRKGKELDGKTDELQKTREAVKNFVSAELQKSNDSLEDAQLSHSKAPSRYSAGLVEIARGTHSENEELLNRLASVVGIEVDFPELKRGSETVARKDSVTEASAPITPKLKPRERVHQSRYIDRSSKFPSKSSAIAV
ncbi:hypothetical protein K505DRAFT_419621 [Melanomma pulvis-pyrius CBS 109.77]|uniref:Uncharacterized protein n=1 Tax=Melanomma pulvis-pyrius CBS 109.77 TaxID=1314802 RepID=A0A6A6X325_9PLEO|nr:hypothetical protein K505DRAFT_419621 [Melanomma pulvis-pyrius CBS 109.77]